MRKVGLVVGLLLCASYEGQAVAKRRQPATRSQAFANCQSHPNSTTCRKLLAHGESAFESGRWDPSQGPFRIGTSGVGFWADCGDRGTGTSFGRWYRVQCAYLSNIDNDADFKEHVRRKEEEARRAAAATEERKRQAKAAREETELQAKAAWEELERREPCAKVWPAYVEPFKQELDSSLERELYNLPELPVPPAWELQRVFDETRTDAVSMLKNPASVEEQLATYVELLYLSELGRSEKRPDACSEYKFDPSGYGEETRKALNARLEELLVQVETRIAEIERQRKLDEAHDRKVRAAIRRAGAKADAWYLDLAYSVAEYGMADVRGHAAFLQDEDGGFALIQVLSGGRAIFSGSFPFTVMVVGIKTANLMHGTALTDIGVHWVKVLGFANYTNVPGGQSQAVRVKPLRKIPHPERGEKLE